MIWEGEYQGLRTFYREAYWSEIYSMVGYDKFLNAFHRVNFSFK